RGAYKEEFLIGREHDRAGPTIGPVLCVHRVSLRAWGEVAFVIDRHQPEAVGADRVQHEKHAMRRSIGHRCSAAPLCVTRGVHVLLREPDFLIYSKAGDGIVSGVGSKQKAMIQRETDTARTLEVVRPANVVDGADDPRTGAACRDTFYLGEHAVG